MNTSQFIEEISKLKEANEETYKRQKARITSDFRLEKETTKSYNGRQILELLQNCDDALNGLSGWEDSRVDITLDTSRDILRVANFGEPFSLEGIGSLLIANTSSKGKEFIGNKGLGFRSILNWANEVHVLSRGCRVSFSKKLAKAAFESLVSSEDQKMLLDSNADYLEENEAPMAVLSMPLVETVDTSDNYSAVIEIHYKKEKELDIEAQLKELNTKLLLFLNHVKKITISLLHEGQNSVLEVDQLQSNSNFIATNNGAWQIMDSGDCLFDNSGDKERYYRIKLAWQESLNEPDAKFYTFFPTAMPTGLPVLIHATFDLDPTRNYLNKSDNNANQYILKATAELILKTAKERFCQVGTCNWDVFRFMSLTGYSNNEMIRVFHNTLDQFRQEEAIIPCLDGAYRSLSGVCYLGDKFSRWVIDNGFESAFGEFIIPKEDIQLNVSNTVSLQDFRQRIEQINRNLSIEARVNLLSIIIEGKDSFFEFVFKSDEKLPLLLGNDGDPVKASKQVFTKDTESLDYELPGFIDDIAFIHQGLYETIKEKLKTQIDVLRLESDKGPSRAIKRLLSPIVNIGSDDIIDVIRHIVSQTNNKLEESATALEVVKEMTRSLFSIFKSNLDRRGNLSTIQNIPLIARDRSKHLAQELNFGQEYEQGKVPEMILGVVRSEEDYLIGNEFWDLKGSNEELFAFFSWLNVNHFVKYEQIEEKINRHNSDAYTNFLLKELEWHQRDVHKQYQVNSIVGFTDLISHPNFSIERLIAWVVKDNQLRDYLRQEHSDKFFVEYNRRRTDFSVFSSYIKFLISDSGITKNYFASIPVDGLNQLKSVDLNCDLFKQLELRESELMEAIHSLGIKTSFNELKPEEVYQIIDELPDSIDPQKSQATYKLIYEYFKNNEGSELKNFTPQFEGLHYFCRQGGIGKEIKIKPINEVYYSDNKRLPQSILNRYWFLNLPRRIGEDRVKNYFGVNLIKDIVDDILVDRKEINQLNEAFNKYLNQLKPIILCYRLEAVKEVETIKSEVSRLRALAVELVTYASFQFGSEQPISLEENELLPVRDTFILKCASESSLNELKNTPQFCDSVAEMFSILFKVHDLKNTFRRIFKDGFEDSLHIIQTDELLRFFEKAQRLVGVSSEERAFWNRAFPGVSLDFSSKEDLKKSLQENLDLDIPEHFDRIDFDHLVKQEDIEFISWIINISNVTCSELLYSNALLEWHKVNLEDQIRDFSAQFEEKLWLKANNSDDLEKKELFFETYIAFEDTSIKEQFGQFLNDNCFELYPSYTQAIQSYVQSHFDLELTEDFHMENVRVKTLYHFILKQYSFGQSLDDMENIIKQEYPMVYSLMYFEGYADQVSEVCNALQEDENEDRSGTDSPDANAVNELEIKFIDLSPNKPGKNLGRNGGGSYSHTSKGERKKTRAGKKEEQKVYKALKSKGYEVRHISKKRDSKHYDLEYKEPGKEWRFLEVKKDSGGFFFLSKAEKDTALTSEISRRYDVAIVDGETINIVRSLFALDSESFEHNSKFYAEPTEFRINFKMNEN